MFRELVRKNKQISDKECRELLINEKRGVLAVCGDNGYPYAMPMNHYYNIDDGCIYFHSGKLGHRFDSLTRSDKVSFCLYEQGYSDKGEWALNIRSVIVFGKIEIIDDIGLISDIAAKLSRKFTDDEEYIRTEIEQHGRATLLLKLVPEHICGKLIKES